MGNRKEELIKEKMIIFEEFLSKLDLTNDQFANTVMKSWMEAYSIGVGDGISNSRIVLEVDIDSMLKIEKERLLSMGKLLPLPPTDGTFVKNLLAMYQKGIDDTIRELNIMEPIINIKYNDDQLNQKNGISIW